MDCRQLRELVSDYVDNDITAEQARLIKEHAASCRACCVFLKTMCETVSIYKEHCVCQELTCPSDVHVRLVQTIRQRWEFKKW